MLGDIPDQTKYRPIMAKMTEITIPKVQSDVTPDRKIVMIGEVQEVDN